LTVVAVAAVIAVLAFVSFSAFSGWYSMSYTDRGIQIVPKETANERRCRQTREGLTARIQTLTGDISAERARLSFVEQRIGETQQACLSEVSNQPDRFQDGCAIPIRQDQRMTTFGRPSDLPPLGASAHYRSVLLDLEIQKGSIEISLSSLIAARERSESERELLDDRCSGD
jgi:hypothetical protein